MEKGFPSRFELQEQIGKLVYLRDRAKLRIALVRVFAYHLAFMTSYLVV